MHSRRHHNQDGTSLVIVLVFISVFGLIAAGLLTEAGASVKYTSTITEHEKKVYAADAGISLGIQQIQQHNELCPTTLSTDTVQTTTVNGIPTRVTCETTTGSTTGGRGYAIYTLSPAADSLGLQSGDAKEVDGPVFVTGGVDGLNKGLILKDGSFRQLRGPEAYRCNGQTSANVTVDPGHLKLCPLTAPTAPTYPAPASIPDPAIAAQPSGACKIFYPGRYEAAPALDLTKTNYFATGIYYFKTSFTFTGTAGPDTYYFGGEPATYEGEPKFEANRPPCASDASAAAAAPAGAYTASGTGVQFIFGNGAALTVDNKSRGELFERTTNGTQQTASPTIIAVPTSWSSAGWLPNPVDTTVVGFTSGSDKSLIVHGVTYAPDHNVVFKVTNVVDAAVFGGVVAWKLDLQSSEGGGGTGLVIVAGNGTPEPRYIVVRATAPFPASASAGRSVVSTAVVQIANDTGKTATIESWRTRGPAEDL